MESTVFLRVHKSYAIHTGKMEGMHHGCVVVSGIKIPVGRTYKAALNKQLGRI